MSAVIACMHLKHNSCDMWLTTHAHPSVICVEVLGHSCQPITGRLATLPSNTAIKIIDADAVYMLSSYADNNFPVHCKLQLFYSASDREGEFVMTVCVCVCVCGLPVWRNK